MNAMTDIPSKIDRAKELAILHASRAKAVTKATKKRNACLYELLEMVHEIERELLGIGKRERREVLQAKYGKTCPTNRGDLLKELYPELPSKRRSKYVALLRYALVKKKADQPLRTFVRANGNIKGCLEKEKELRAKKSGGSGKGLKSHKVTKRENRASMRATI
jgi:hypothetical protein